MSLRQIARTAFYLGFIGQSIAKSPSEVIQSDSYFYGQSPPVYPSPEGKGLGSWEVAYHDAAALVTKMSLEEMVTLTEGVGSNTGCVGFVSPVGRLGFPGMCLQDAENGIRGGELVSAWPSGIHVAASWNKNLANFRGIGMGGEYKAKGINFVLGPVVGPLGRTVTSGRIWEGFSSDPYLAGVLVSESIRGIQSTGVGAVTKHFIGNEQETSRKPVGNLSSISSNIDDKTMHEMYLWPFQDAVYAGSAGIMCSYQRINNSYACQNSKTLNGLLKEELGFQGFVVTDWDAIHGGVASSLAGLDLSMPDSSGFWGPNLTEAVKNGSVPESRVTDMVTRILASWYQLGQDKLIPNPGFGMPADVSAPHTPVDARNPAFKNVLYQGAVEGHVLLKNEGALPLKRPKVISVFGFSARSVDRGSFDSTWDLGYSPYDFNGVILPTIGPVPASEYRPIAINGTLYSGGGSGASTGSLLSSPMDALMQQAFEDDTAIFYDFTTSSPTVSSSSEACLVFTNLYGSEDFDRPAIQSDYTSALIQNVAKTCKNTIVVSHNAGTGLLNPDWYDNENVTAVIFAHLPGQFSGKALVDLLYGRENFSGKLPYTVAMNETQYGPLLYPDQPEGQFSLFPQANFSEGSLFDYRRFDAMNMTPRFEFGYGLSYTNFKYSKLLIRNTKRQSLPLYPTGAISQGGQEDLWKVLANVQVEVANTGSVEGAEVAQLYLSNPSAGQTGAPLKQLRGFDKKRIHAGASATYKFSLNRRDLSVWDTENQKWRLDPGNYTIRVGSSSRQLPLEAYFVL